MAMLAEKKYKNKWSNDPRNKSWSKDTNRFGFQMLERMGWKSGKGLGANEDGQTSHVKVSKKNNNIGLGADKSNVDNWLEHQQAFDSLLAELNQSTDGNSDQVPRKKHKLQEKARESKKRVNYHRFIKSKDLSSYTDTDMACILGQRPSQTAPATPQRDQSEDSDSDRGSTPSCPASNATPDLGVKMIASGQTVQEYFARKMQELQAKRNGLNVNSRECESKLDADHKGNEDSTLTENESGERKKKSKKRKTKSKECNVVQEIVEKDTIMDEGDFCCQETDSASSEDVQERKRRKKERKQEQEKKCKSKKKKKRKQKDGE